MLIHQYIEAHSIHRSDSLALRFKRSEFTYAQLNQHANQLAGYLNSLGVNSEDRVAVCLEPSLEIAVCLLAIFKAGGVYVPLEPSYPLERLDIILTETQPKVLITQTHLLPNLPAIAEHIFCIDQDWQTIQYLSTQNPDTKISLTQTAYIIYTSGTTGKPKGVMVSHSNLLHYILVAQEKYGFHCDDVMPAIARFTFSISLFELLSPLVAGGTLMILERDHILDFERMAQVLHQVTVIHAGPSYLRSLLAYLAKKELQHFSSLRHVSTGGDMVPVDILERMKAIFQYADIFVIYGCSEASCMGCTYFVPRGYRLTKSLVGQPFNNVSIRLYDESQKLVPIGTTGEIYIGGAGIAKGYLDREELTQTKFLTIDGIHFYRTGDIGCFDEGGNLKMLGRDDFQIKLRGIRIEAEEIETTLNRHASVKQSLVMARDDIAGDTRLVAYVVTNQNQIIRTHELREFIKNKLPEYMVPNAFIFLDTMPLNPNGKIDRYALPSLDKTKYFNEEFIAPQDEVEKQLAIIWAKHLGHDLIGIHDNFFDLGGHSLLSVTLMLEIEEVFNYQFPLESLHKVNNISEMAQWIREKPSQQNLPDEIPPGLSRDEYRALLFHSAGREGKHIGKRGLIIETAPDEMRSSQPFIWIGDINVSKELDLKQPIYTMPANSWEPLHSPENYIPVIAALLVDELLTVQPTGPYTIGSYCFEGLVALEMAQQLQKKGKEVALLVMIDKFGPSDFYHIFGKLDWYYNVLRFELFQLITLPLSIIEKWRYIKKRLQRRAEFKMFIPQQGEALTKHKTITTLYEASNHYIHREYSGRVVLIKSTKIGLSLGSKDLSQSNFSWLFPYFGWESLLSGKIETYEIPCQHLEVYVDPYVKDLGNLITTSLS
jgi:amino acid adenylation domain-containing protein